MGDFRSYLVIGGVMLLGFVIVITYTGDLVAGVMVSILFGGISLIFESVIQSAISEYWDRIKEKDEWFREELARPLLDEVSEVAKGDFPGEPGGYQSKWKTELDEATRQRDTDIRDMFNDYVEILDEINRCVNVQQRLANSFVHELPGGRNGPPAYIVGDIVTTGGPDPDPHSQTRITGPMAAPEPVGEEIELQEWLINVWPAFEEAESETEFRSELMAQYHDLKYSDETITYWELQENQPNWQHDFWKHYKNDHITKYYEAITKRNRCEEEIIEIAAQIEEIMKAEIRRRYG